MPGVSKCLTRAGPSTLSFNYQLGGAAPAAQTISITSANPSSGVSVTAGVALSGCGWLNLSGANGSTPYSASASVNTAGLTAGSYTCTITFVAPGIGNQTVQASLTVTPATSITAGPSTLSFSYQLGGAAPPAQTISVSSANPSSGVSVTGSLGSACGWLNLSGASGSTSYNASASVNTAGLTAGMYSCTITFSATGAASQMVQASLTVTAGTSITASPSTLSFNYQLGGVAPSAQQISVTSANPSSGVSVTGSLGSACGWLNLSGASGSTSYNASASVNTAGLTAGIYSCTITFSASGAASQTVQASMTVTTGTSITASPSTLNFNYQLGGAAPLAQTITVSSANPSSGVSVTGSFGGLCGWLNLSGGSGSTQYIATVSVNTAGLTAGIYSCTLTFSASGATSQTVQASMTVTTGTSITATPSTLSFTYQMGGVAPSAQQISVTSANPSSGVSVTGSLGSGCGWLNLSGASGSTAYNASASVNTAGLTAGSFSCTVTFSASGAANKTVQASLTVTAGTSITASPSTLSFSYQLGGAAPLAQTITISSANPSTGVSVTGSLGSGCGWLNLSGASGSTSYNATASVNTAGLTAGSYSCTITFSASGAASQTVQALLTVTSGTTTTLSASPSLLSFNAVVAGSAPPNQSITVTSTPSGSSFSVNPGTGCSWVTITPTSGTTPGNLSVSVNVSGLAPNNYSCTITISAPNATSVSVQVSLALTGATLTISPSTVSFTYVMNSAPPAAQTFSVNSANPSSGVAFQVVSGSGCAWLNVNPSSGNTPGNVTASVNTSGVAVNTSYICTLTINAPNASNTPQVNASLTVTPPALTVSPTTLSFNVPAGSSTAVGQTLSALGPATSVNFTATAASSGNWLSVNPTSGSTPLTLNVTANPAGLAANTYNGTVTVSSSGSPQTVTVSLVVSALPALTVAPSPLNFQVTAGGTAPAAQTISVFASDGSTVSFNVSQTAQGGNWLNAMKLAGQNISVAVSPAGLSPGQYSGNVTVASSTPANPSQQQVPVTLTVNSPPPSIPIMSVAPQSLTFSFVQNGTPSSNSLTVSNTGGGTLTAGAAPSSFSNWLNVPSALFSVLSGGQQVLSVSADPTGLAPGTYVGQITLTNGSGQQIVIPVVATVSPAPQSIVLSQTALTFTAVAGGPDPVPQSVAVGNGGSGTMTITLESPTTTGQPWLTATANSFNVTAGAPQNVQIAATPSMGAAGGLPEGVYFGTVLVQSASAGNTPQAISIRLNVVAAATVVPPAVTPLGVVLTSGASQQIQITNQSSTPISFTSVSTTDNGIQWFTASPASGIIGSAQTITLQPQFGSLASGVYNGSLRILFADGTLSIVGIVGLIPSSGSTAAAAAAPNESGLRPLATTICQPIAAAFTSLSNGQQIEAGSAFTIQVQVKDACGNLLDNGGVNVYFSNNPQAYLPLNGIGNGLYRNSYTFDQPAGGINTPVTVIAKPAAQFSTGTADVITVTVIPQTQPVPEVLGIVNSGSYQGSSIVTPGGWISIFGADLADGPQNAPGVPLGVTLANAQVSIGNVLVPLNYAADGQVNAQLPYDLVPNQQTQVLITHGTDQSVAKSVTIADTLPAIFTVPQTGTGQGAITDPNGSVLNTTHPAHAGDAIVIYCTGLGAVSSVVALGAATPVPAPVTVAQPSLTISGVPATITFSGLSPYSVGLYQINAVVPTGIAPGNAPVVIAISGKTSQADVTIAVQ
ncbi:MAG TPA: hypothetical protein VIX19_11345 [Terriglobales bacterium]